MKLPLETSSHLTAPSSGESGANSMPRFCSEDPAGCAARRLGSYGGNGLLPTEYGRGAVTGRQPSHQRPQSRGGDLGAGVAPAVLLRDELSIARRRRLARDGRQGLAERPKEEEAAIERMAANRPLRGIESSSPSPSSDESANLRSRARDPGHSRAQR
jgi:hypothetical protein